MANPTDKRFHQLTLAIQKAINAIETPVKEKHVRSTIIGTFQEQSAVTYWMVAIRQPLQDNRIVAWKFCHVTHKLLREGHPACLDDSQRHTGMIENLGKLWVHLREGYGRLVHLYCALLVSKLKFHQRNPRFPGNMQLTADELDAIAENDVNNYFQLCVELFDYMDDILNLQAAVFESLGNARANSMTASGQCRLAALIPCAQDSSHIYDCNVRLLFRLHAALPADTLAGHRERFRQQFKKLSSFYKHASSLQYYRNLLTLPVLPSNPPNFLLQSDFGTYVTPVVSIPEPPPDEVDSVASLIDTSDTISQVSHLEHAESFDTRATPSPQPDPIVERDRLIDHLQNELKRMRNEVSQLVQERNTMLGSMREHCTRLESQLQATKSELVEEKQRAEILSAETPEIKQKLVQTEDKAKVIDEKFQKLKGAYTQLREEHISLIRQKAEVDKLASSMRASAAQHESSKMLLQQQLNDRMKDVELLQQSASSSEEIEAYKNEISNLRSELENTRQKEVELESLKASMETLEIEHKTAMTEQKEKVILITSELKEVNENLEKVQKEKEEKEAQLSRAKEELNAVKMESGADVKRILEEKEAALQEVAQLKQQYQQEKENINNEYENVKMDYDERYVKQSAEILRLQQKVDELVDSKNSTEMRAELLESDVNDQKNKLTEVTEIKINIEKALEEKERKISYLENKIKEVEYENTVEVEKLKKLLEGKNELCQTQTAESEKLTNKISELETMLSSKDENITELIKKLNKELGVTDDVFNNFKELLADKDQQILALNTKVTKLSEQLSHLEDELKETNAELEIGNNELIILKEDYENMKVQHEFELSTKNNELVKLEKEFTKQSTEIGDIEIEKNKIIDNLLVEKEVLENKMREINETEFKLNSDIDIISHQKAEMENNLNSKIDELTTELEEMKVKVDYHRKIINNKEITLDLVMKERDDLQVKLDKIKQLQIKEKDEMEVVLSEKIKDNQVRLTSVVDNYVLCSLTVTGGLHDNVRFCEVLHVE